MLVMKYEKLGSSKYISHLDMLRHMQRMLKRASMQVDYSKGYNPHPIIFFAPPSPLGQSSVSEYCTMAIIGEESNFLQKMNDVAIGGIKGIKLFKAEKNPNLAAKVRWAEYLIQVNDEEKARIESAFARDKYEITYTQKGAEVTKEVRALMKSCSFENGVASVILALGDKTLRSDRFLDSVGMHLRDAKRVRLFVEENEKLVDVDCIL